jgi:hypothetical protein
LWLNSWLWGLHGGYNLQKLWHKLGLIRPKSWVFNHFYGAYTAVDHLKQFFSWYRCFMLRYITFCCFTVKTSKVYAFFNHEQTWKSVLQSYGKINFFPCLIMTLISNVLLRLQAFYSIRFPWTSLQNGNFRNSGMLRQFHAGPLIAIHDIHDWHFDLSATTHRMEGYITCTECVRYNYPVIRLYFITNVRTSYQQGSTYGSGLGDIGSNQWLEPRTPGSGSSGTS